MTTSQPPKETARHASTGYGFVIPGVEVVRHGRVEPFLHARPTLTSTAAQWAGLALEGFSVPACVIPRHEHIENFLHVVLEWARQIRGAHPRQGTPLWCGPGYDLCSA